MPQISTQEFGRLPLRVHDFLRDVPLHDAWVVELPHTRTGITLVEFLHATRARKPALSPATRALLALRFAVGKLFGWDRELSTTAVEPFATRLTADDRARSLAPPGTPDGLFRVVYRFENEQLLEVINRTVHGALMSALVESADAYHFYFAVYVRPVGRLTPLYMGLINPFRKWIVYPSLLRAIRASWDRIRP